MTIQQCREYLKECKTVECYGLNVKLLPDDLVVIKNDINPNVVSTNIVQKYSIFIDLNVNLVSAIKNLEITDINLKKDDNNPHIWILELDTVKHINNKEDNGRIGAGMKYV